MCFVSLFEQVNYVMYWEITNNISFIKHWNDGGFPIWKVLLACNCYSWRIPALSQEYVTEMSYVTLKQNFSFKSNFDISSEKTFLAFYGHRLKKNFSATY